MTSDPVRVRFWAWLALAVALLGAFFLRVQPRLQVDTDILALLPSSERDPQAEHLLREFSGQLGRRLVFLVGDASFPRARDAAQAFAARLRQARAIGEVRLDMTADAQAATDWLPYHHGLLADRDRALLQSGQEAELERSALQGLYALAGPPRPLPVTQDPLNLAGRFLLQQVPELPNAALRESLLTVADGGRTWIVVLVRTAGDAFSVAAQDEVRTVLADARRAVEARGARLVGSGVMLHAVAAGEAARREMTLFGTLSTVGVLLLSWLAFASLRPLLMSLAVIGFGAVAGLFACALAFGSVHLLTLVFGTSLIGVAVDYSMHFFADQFRDAGRPWDGRVALRHVGRPILIGHLCAVVGYLGLVLAPFPGLRQMAVFSVAGLVASCGTVLCLYPVLARARPGRSPLLLRVARRLALPSAPGPVLLVGAIVATGAVVLGLTRLQWLDDVRLLQSSPPALLSDEAEARRMLGPSSESRFFLVQGASAEEVLQREEALRGRLDAAQAQGSLQSYLAISRALPSLQRQRQSRDGLARAYAPDGAGARVLATLGLPPAAAQQLVRAVAEAPELSAERFFALRSAERVRLLWSQSGSGVASAVTLQGVRDAGVLQAAAAGLPGVRFIDKLTDTSLTLTRCRTIAAQLTAAAYALIALMLAWRYGPRSAVWLLVPPLGGAAATLGLLGLMGTPVNFFNLLALLLVLGMGVDYAVFLREGRAASPPVLLAILLSTATTLLSFGLLAGSRTPFIRSVGLTLAMGIGLVFLLAVILHRGGFAAPASQPRLGDDPQGLLP